MCGIVGQFHFDHAAHVRCAEIHGMLAPLRHRGPDGEGITTHGNVGLGHCRLSIIDVAGGAQPLGNEDGTVQVVFNGEIYNFPELRRGLLARGHVFRTRSDTEVIVHLYEEHGPDCVHHLDGMFAFALWDSVRQRLLLARDRVGIKPLYYARTSDRLCFASELKSILTVPGVPRDPDPAALQRFLALHYVAGDATLFRAIRKLPPGHLLLATAGGVTLRPYWDLTYTRARHDRPFDAVVGELQELLARTVRAHLLADVPVGVLLSGGLDSSAILSLAASAAGRPLHTYTVGFDGPGVVDERPYAREVAARFGARHHELSFTAEDFWRFLPAYGWHMEEPVCEPPAVALYYLTRRARQDVKVLLSGEGGDEAFAGYPNYRHQLRLARLAALLGPLSRPVGTAVAFAGDMLGHDRARRYGSALGRPLADHYFSRTASPASWFNRLRSQLLVPGGPAPAAPLAGLPVPAPEWSLLDRMLYIDTKTWLPDDLLVKADKMTMANSLELRVPLLDHHVLEFAASLPAHFKIQGRETKRVLKAACARLLPPAIVHRRKAGFPVPYDAWLRGPLAGRVRDTLLSARSLGRGYFQPRAIERLLQAHARGGCAREVFSLLALEFWHQAFSDGPTAVVRPAPLSGPASPPVPLPVA